jgi:UDP:flavonoid glycosyltransferase YjiC (YdhE family)
VSENQTTPVGCLEQPAQKVVLSTVGTFGDLHPFIALAKSLQTWGIKPILAVSEDHLAKALAAKIEAVAIFPSFEEILRAYGSS